MRGEGCDLILIAFERRLIALVYLHQVSQICSGKVLRICNGDVLHICSGRRVQDVRGGYAHVLEVGCIHAYPRGGDALAKRLAGCYSFAMDELGARVLAGRRS